MSNHWIIIKNLLEIRKSIKAELSVSDVNMNIGNVYWRLNDYENALKYYFDALDYYEKNKMEESIADCYNNIGLIFLEQKYFK